MNSIDPFVPRKILVTRLRYIGDVILTVPVVRALRKRYPDARIFYLAERGMGEVLQDDSDVELVILLDRFPMEGESRFSHFVRTLRFLAEIRSHGFDLVIDLFCNPRSALITFLSGARYRVGFDVRFRGVVYNIKIARVSSKRVTDAYLDGVRTIGIEPVALTPDLQLSVAEIDWANGWAERRLEGGDGPIVCLNPGASWPAKTWPGENFAVLADRLMRDQNARIVFIQGPDNGSSVRSIASTMENEAIVADLMPIRQVGALISVCDVVVSNDSGLMHLAPAVGTPSIGIFGPSDSSVWFPYSPSMGHTPMNPAVDRCCGKDFCTEPVPCITTVQVDDVYDATTRALASVR